MQSPLRAGWSNWAGNQRCEPKVQASPQGEEHLIELVDLANSRDLTLRVSGSGHSFTDTVCTDGLLLSLIHI